ncbi:zinc finger protein 43 [Culex quinquefasciatus]|uniref:zinc finger protein 43 n=1 Tax=Culex quinquefasciatus TaxID=7176 RepID=UPI0018E39467|nr:zinc finger protein 43 [Culex quinquefasciatus]
MTEESLLQDCLTCRRKTETFLRIRNDIADDEDTVESVLAKHFWFEAIQYRDRVLCTSCWEKIDEFHKFYCEVEERWGLHVEVKTEQLEEEGVASEVVKAERLESDGGSFGEDSDGDFEPGEAKMELPDDFSEDSEEESTTPIAKRKRSARDEGTGSGRKTSYVRSHKRANRERNDLIAKYVQLQCDICSERFATFPRLLLHYKRSHETQGYVTCCEKVFHKRSVLVEHLRKVHEFVAGGDDESQFRCELCEPVRNFKDEEGLQLHNVVCHTAEGERIYKCDQCEKAFDSEWALSGHKYWHQNIESLNICCEKCNKYFNSARTLNTHIRAFHPEGTTTTSSSFSTTMSTDAITMAEPTLPDQLIAGAAPEDSFKAPSQSARATSATRKAPKSAEELAQEDDLIRQFCTLLCESCDFVADSFYTLERHYKTEHDQRGYAICCGRKFCKKRRLYEHCQRHVNPDAFRCEVCNKSFTESDGLEKHNKWVHTPDSEKPFKCEICDAAFYKDYLLRNHMKYHISMEQKIFNCKDCDKSFGTAVLLRAHQQNIHGAASSWVCDICAKGFVHKSQLETHRLSHSEEGAASLKKQCERCKKWLKNKDTYTNHLKRCLAGGPVTCDICGKEAVNELALASHKRFNHEDKPAFACSYCGKQFKRLLRLKEHEANHRGELLYSCPYCPRQCNSSSNMYTHKKVAHPELWAAKVADRYYKR